MSRTAGAPQEIAWWDRLLIRFPGYSLIAWAGCYGLHQQGLPLKSAVLIFFLLAIPLLAAWQIFHVWQSRKRLRAWRKEQVLSQPELGVANIPQICGQLAQIAAEKTLNPEPKKPRFGAWGIFLLAMLIAAIAIAAGIFLAKAGAPKIAAFAIITLLLGGLGPLQVMGVHNRAYRAIARMPKKLSEIQDLVTAERYMPSSQRSTQSTDSTLEAAVLIINEALGHAQDGCQRAAVDCVDLLAVLARDSWPASSKPRALAENLHRRINGALAQLSVEERKSRKRGMRF